MKRGCERQGCATIHDRKEQKVLKYKIHYTNAKLVYVIGRNTKVKL